MQGREGTNKKNEEYNCIKYTSSNTHAKQDSSTSLAACVENTGCAGGSERVSRPMASASAPEDWRRRASLCGGGCKRQGFMPAKNVNESIYISISIYT